MIVAIDFDGTIVDHRFPEIGGEVPGAFAAMKEFQKAGAQLILWTMRSDMRSTGVSDEGHKADRDYLGEAVEFCRERGVEFWGVNQSPGQESWSTSPKQYAHIYIDDAALGCPLRENPRMGGKSFVDWSIVGPKVMEKIQTVETP